MALVPGLLMKTDLAVKSGIIIPSHELEITASRAGGPGGQHVNKTDSKITVRWNVPRTIALDIFQKDLVLKNLQHKLTTEGDLIVHYSASRSQHQNREMALKNLADEVRKALFVPKKRMATKASKAIKESRLQQKSQRSLIKKMRTKKIQYD